MSSAHSYDIIVRGGSVADGRGGPVFEADVAVRDGLIVEVGRVVGSATEEIDAKGLLVTPGFIDLHTHYDGQVTWSDRLDPSSEHGVTTIVTGNCGVGFAPVRGGDHDRLIRLMAGVEDIPEVVMAAGLTWQWETFPEYLDAVDSHPHDVDIAALLPHSALRVYVMGQRAVDREVATSADISAMAELAHGAMRAGAMGFGTSRALQQRSITGEPIPSVRASEDELRGILAAISGAGHGVFQLLSDFFEFTDIDGEFEMLRRLVAETRVPTMFTVNQKHSVPDGWRRLLDLTATAAADGLPIKAQVLGRPTGLLLGHELSLTPFEKCPTYAALRPLPLEARLVELRRPDVRAQIIAEAAGLPEAPWHVRFELGDPPCYEPRASESMTARALSAGCSPAEVAYDVLLQDDGHQLMLHAMQNYAAGSLDACYEMLRDENSVLGLGDGGAHLGLICDSSFPTTMLSYWARDRRGPRLSVEEVVHALTLQPAHAIGLEDRGLIEPGKKADLNVIDHEHLREHRPVVVHDLPGGGRRMVQHATGYVATVLSGQVTRRDGVPTGALPGRLVRGPRRSTAVS